MENRLLKRPFGVLVNGSGCIDFGSKRVLIDFVQNFEKEWQVVVVAPFERPREIAHHRLIWLSLPRFFLQSTSRFLTEMLIVAWGWSSICGAIINMSNYGINISSKEVVFVHNAFLVESNREGSLGLWAKQICLLFAGWSRASFVVQTRHMQRKLAKKYDINIARIALLRPPPAALVSSLVTNRVFDFQCFYPCSRYTHKRVDFAEDVFCRIEDSKIGLVITADGVNDLPSTRRSIRYLGNKSETEVASWLSCSDILFFCSLSESLGLPLVDALRRGKPAVLPDLEYAREIFGDAAVYYSPDSIDSAVAAVGYACRNMQELKCAAELRWIVYRREVVTYANQFRAMVRLAARESSEKETTPEI